MTTDQKPHLTPQNIAILGGTFDPIHLGHINTAKNVAQWLELDNIILLPAHIPPHKATPSISSKVRANMVEMVCKNEPLLKCDQRELNREKPSFTVDTLKEFKQEQPNSRLFFLIGMDSLITFTTWHQWQEILTLCHLVVSTRPGYNITQLPSETKELIHKYQITDKAIQLTQADAGHILFAPPCHYDISSSNIRERVANQQSLTDILPKNVTEYILSNKLYSNTGK